MFEIQCNNGKAGCQKQSLNQRPLPICSAGSTGILNRSKLSECGPLTINSNNKNILNLKAFGTKGEERKNRIHISVTFIICHYFHFPFFGLRIQMVSILLFFLFVASSFISSFGKRYILNIHLVWPLGSNVTVCIASTIKCAVPLSARL